MVSHTENNHIEIDNTKEIKCIACEYSVKTEVELTKHYEEKHINNSKKKEKEAHQNKNIKCKNGPNCRFLREAGAPSCTTNLKIGNKG